MGNTAKQRLGQIKRLSNFFEVVGFTDSNQEMQGKKLLWEGYKMISYHQTRKERVDYLCILSIDEQKIRKKIYCENIFELSKIIDFHELCMMDSFKMNSTNDCWKIMMENVHPKQKRSTEKWQAYEYLKKTYSYVLYDKKFKLASKKRMVCIEAHIRPIWILWLQGMKQASEVVRMCVHSVERICVGRDEHIYLLDENNLFDYIELPDYIVYKWKNGMISNTHFSDIVRVCLLNTYGGIWIDATVYFTGNKILSYIKKDELFMFSRHICWETFLEPHIIANWFISAAAENELLMLLEALLYEYWKRESEAVDYCFFHIFWMMIVEYFPNEWNHVKKIPRDSARLLGEEMNNKYDSERFEYLKSVSDIHKLSIKTVYERKNGESFYAKIYKMEKDFGNECIGENQLS